MKNRLLKLFLVAVTLWVAIPLIAQDNIIVNWDFDQGNTGFQSDYEFKSSGVVNEGQYCIDNNSSGHGGGIGWASVSGYGGSGKFMMANGFGGNNNPSKAVWKQTVSVTTQTEYTFSCKVVNLGISVLGQSPNPAKLHVFINGLDVSGEYVIPTDNTWHSWSNIQHWNSGSATQAEIAIYDYFTGNSGLGDDFGLDQISFIPGETYSVTAIDDQGIWACFNMQVDIDVLANDVILPNIDDAVVMVVENPTYGTVEVLNDKRIRYLFNDENHIGDTDQFKYQVNNHGATSEAWVYVSLYGAPSDIALSGIPNDHLCVEDFASFSPSGTCNNGSPITDSGWEWASDPDGPWNTLSLEPFDLPVGDYYLRFWAENDCGSAESDPEFLRVCDKPELNTMTIPEPPVICEGAWLPADYLAQVWVTSWNNDNGTESWEVNHENGGWMPQTSLSNGDWLRFRAENCCGEVITGAVMVHTTQGPQFIGSYSNPFDPYYCLGVTLNMPSVYPQFDAHGMATEGFWAYLDGSEYQRIDGNPTLTEEWDDRIITYVLDSDCGGLIPYPESFPLTVVFPPEVQSVTVFPQTVCIGSPIETDSIVEWHHGTPDLQHCTWRYAPIDNPTAYQDFYPADGIPEEGMYYVNYYAEANECGFSGDCGDPTVISVITTVDEWLEMEACDSLVLESGEVIYGNKVIESDSYEPCFHRVFLDIVIHHSDTVVEPITSCHDEFVWHDKTYYRSDETQIDQWSTTNIHGCDSVVELHLDFGPYAIITEYRTACNEYVWPRNGVQYTFSTTDSYFKPSTDDEVCDSLIYLSLVVGHDVQHVIDTSACESFYWQEAGTWCYDGQQTYEHTFNTAIGCDSVVTMNVRWIQLEYSTQLLERCDSITINGTLYDQPGSFYVDLDTIHSQVGCDSIIHRIRLTITNSDYVGHIHGEDNVYVASSLMAGIYRYEIDTEGIIGSVEWSLSNPDWQIVDTDAVSCRVQVTTPGTCILKARFKVDCGEMEREFVIHAGFFDVEEYQTAAVQVFPNPTQGSVTVVAQGIKQIRVVNMMGQTLEVRDGGGEEEVTLNLSDFGPSVYLLEVETACGWAKKRIVVCK